MAVVNNVDGSDAAPIVFLRTRVKGAGPKQPYKAISTRHSYSLRMQFHLRNSLGNASEALRAAVPCGPCSWHDTQAVRT